LGGVQNFADGGLGFRLDRFGMKSDAAGGA